MTQKIYPRNLLKAFVFAYAVLVLIPIIVRSGIDGSEAYLLDPKYWKQQMWFWKILGLAVGGGGLIMSFMFLTIKINWYTIGSVILGLLSICTVLSDFRYLDKFDGIFITLKIAVSCIIIGGIIVDSFLLTKEVHNGMDR